MCFFKKRRERLLSEDGEMVSVIKAGADKTEKLLSDGNDENKKSLSRRIADLKTLTENLDASFKAEVIKVDKQIVQAFAAMNTLLGQTQGVFDRDAKIWLAKINELLSERDELF